MSTAQRQREVTQRRAVTAAVRSNWPTSSPDLQDWHPDDVRIWMSPQYDHLTYTQKNKKIQEQRQRRMIDAVLLAMS